MRRSRVNLFIHLLFTPPKRLVLAVFIVFLMFSCCKAFAYDMSGSNYRIWSSTVSIGGTDSQTSTSYGMRDTIGENIVGEASSTSYKLRSGYQPMLETSISLSVITSPVTMLPAIGGLTGGIATGTYEVVVITDNPAGYSLSVNASTSPAMKSGDNSFADYIPVSVGTPDFIWQISNLDSEFGFTAEGDGIVQIFKDDGGSCNAGSGNTPDSCWYGFSTSAENISLSYSSNHPSGQSTTIKLKAQSGTGHYQQAGSYEATITNTAVAN